ncbi:MAG: bifunctional diguanylate cyclase/phosphodiesterase [Aquimonas sp.]|nr:bifunctional diguanylate cyclase/phosphodiesterase [Aquimonas sp.]
MPYALRDTGTPSARQRFRQATRAGVLVFGLLFLVLGGMLWRAYLDQRSAADRQAYAQASGLEGQTYLILRNLTRAMLGIAGDARQLFDNVPDTADALLRQSVIDVFTRHPELAALELVDAEDPQCGLAGADSLHLAPPSRGESSGRWGLPLYLRIEGLPASTDIRCVRAELAADGLDELLAELALGRGGEAYLLTASGAVMAARGHGGPLSPEARSPLLQALQAAITSGREPALGFALVQARGHELHAAVALPRGQSLLMLAPLALLGLLAALGMLVGGLVLRSLQRSMQRLEWTSSHDGLTGLPNRREIAAELRRRISSQRSDEAFSVLLIDLDHFQLINDSLGHGVGDVVLTEVATRLSRLADRAELGDTCLGRFGGDEFMLILDAPMAVPLEHALLACLRSPVEALGTLHHLTASVGHVRYPEHGESAVVLLKHADLAMSTAKKLGRDCIADYDPRSERQAEARLLVVSQLRRALEQDEFELHYQPKFELTSGRPSGLEALVRWRHPERGLLGPDEFIAICEESGLIVPLGSWILREAGRQLAALAAAGRGDLPIAVNVSAVQFLHGRVVEEVQSLLAAFGLAGTALEIELTESAVMANPELAAEAMRKLRAMGVRLSLDDFGTGYSSLAYLKGLPLDSLKIDRAFVNDLGRDPDDEAICASIIALAHTLSLKVIAEGVETEDQQAWLRARGCDQVQGYLHARPMPMPELLELLAKR